MLQLPAYSWTPSPNYSSRGGQRVRLVVVHDCFAGDERFLTRDGMKTFAEMAGQTTYVLTPKGWRLALISNFGSQQLTKITFAQAFVSGRAHHWQATPSKVRKTVRATAAHRWVLEDGSDTRSLKVGDVICGTAVVSDSRSPEYKNGFRHGFIFGDGSFLHKSVDGVRTYQAGIYGRKELATSYFEDIRHYPSREAHTKEYVGTAIYKCADDLKTLPSLDQDPAYLAGFMAGWIMSDGCTSGRPKGRATLATKKASILRRMAEIAPVGGYSVIGEVQEYVQTVGYKPGEMICQVNIRSGAQPWIVKSIDPDVTENVFCATLLETDAGRVFTLDGGILTGNCEGSYAGSVSWFAMARSQVSAHVVLSDDGARATQMVAWGNKAWHVCNMNPFSEGIEAAGYSAKGLGAPEWQALANIVAWRLRKNGVPCQRATAANNWTGWCQHVDLGTAGGGHHDVTSDPAVVAAFAAMIAAAYDGPMPASWGGMSGAPAPAPAAPASWTPSASARHDLAEGSLEWAQAALNKLAIPLAPLIVDGMDGPATEQAMRLFQMKVGLFVDGTYGPDTEAKLEAALATLR